MNESDVVQQCECGESYFEGYTCINLCFHCELCEKIVIGKELVDVFDLEICLSCAEDMIEYHKSEEAEVVEPKPIYRGLRELSDCRGRPGST